MPTTMTLSIYSYNSKELMYTYIYHSCSQFYQRSNHRCISSGHQHSDQTCKGYFCTHPHLQTSKQKCQKLQIKYLLKLTIEVTSPDLVH